MKLKRHPPGKFCVAARKASNVLISRRTVVLHLERTRLHLAIAAQKIEATVLVWTHAASGSSAWNNARITVFAVPARLSDPEVSIHALRGCLVSGVGQGGNRTLLIDVKNRPKSSPFYNGISCMTGHYIFTEMIDFSFWCWEKNPTKMINGNDCSLREKKIPPKWLLKMITRKRTIAFFSQKWLIILVGAYCISTFRLTELTRRLKCFGFCV